MSKQSLMKADMEEDEHSKGEYLTNWSLWRLEWIEDKTNDISTEDWLILIMALEFYASYQMNYFKQCKL